MKKAIGYELREAEIMLTRYFEKQESINQLENIKGPQAMALVYLVDHQDREIFQKDLELEMGIRKSTASKLVDRLVKNGYLTKTTSKKDGRSKQLLITNKAIADSEKIKAYVHETEAMMRKNISEEELEQFFQTLEKIKGNIQ